MIESCTVLLTQLALCCGTIADAGVPVAIHAPSDGCFPEHVCHAFAVTLVLPPFNVLLLSLYLLWCIPAYVLSQEHRPFERRRFEHTAVNPYPWYCNGHTTRRPGEVHTSVHSGSSCDWRAGVGAGTPFGPPFHLHVCSFVPLFRCVSVRLCVCVCFVAGWAVAWE